MNIEYWIKRKSLRIREKDIARIKSMISSAEINVNVVKGIKVTENSATLVFREIYESIRQIGDAKLWSEGYEPLTHEVSIDILKAFDIKNKFRLNSLDRIMKIRHDINYRGFRSSIEQAREILEFWNDCCVEIVGNLKREIS